MLEANLHLCLLRVLSTVCVGVLDFFASWLPLRPHYFLTILLETHCPLNINCLGLNLLKYTLLYVVHSSNQIRTYFLKTEDVFKVFKGSGAKGSLCVSREVAATPQQEDSCVISGVSLDCQSCAQNTTHLQVALISQLFYFF